MKRRANLLQYFQLDIPWRIIDHHQHLSLGITITASEAEEKRWNKAFRTVSFLLIDLSIVTALSSFYYCENCLSWASQILLHMRCERLKSMGRALFSSESLRFSSSPVRSGFDLLIYFKERFLGRRETKQLDNRYFQYFGQFLLFF